MNEKRRNWTTMFFNFSTDSGWDNPFRPDGDLSREADEIVELIKGGKPITPTPGQNAPPLPGCDVTGKSAEHDSSSTSPLLKSANCHSSPRPGQENGSAHGGTPAKGGSNQQPVNEKVRNKKYITDQTYEWSLILTSNHIKLNNLFN